MTHDDDDDDKVIPRTASRGYSRVPNKRVGGNKHVGRKNLQNLINM